MRPASRLAVLGPSESAPPMGFTPATAPDRRRWVCLALAATLLTTCDLQAIEAPFLRLVATAFVVALVVPSARVWWRSNVGVAVILLWVVLSLSNLVSPLRSVRSVLDLTSTVLCVVLVVRIAQLFGGDRVRRWLTGYATIVLLGTLLGRVTTAIVSGSISWSVLGVESSAEGFRKGLILISPCPSRAVPARIAFAAFKVVLLGAMLTVDRPKLGVLLALTLAGGVGLVAVLLHRAARSRNVMLMCVVILPIIAIPVVVLGNLLLKVYSRYSDFSGRGVLWQTALEEVEQTRSLLGVGFRNSLSSEQAVAAIDWRFGGLEYAGNIVHNVFLQLVVEFGLVGVVLAVVFLWVTLVGLLRIRSIAMQARLAVDLFFVICLCLVEPVLDPNRLVFVLLCLTVVRIHQHAAAEAPSMPWTGARLRATGPGHPMRP